MGLPEALGGDDGHGEALLDGVRGGGHQGRVEDAGAHGQDADAVDAQVTGHGEGHGGHGYVHINMLVLLAYCSHVRACA